jgi:hypothetical protein
MEMDRWVGGWQYLYLFSTTIQMVYGNSPVFAIENSVEKLVSQYRY